MIGKLVGAAVWTLMWAAIIPLASGDLRWVEGWIFVGWFLAMCGTCTGYVYVKDPALLAERYRAPGTGGQRGWDVIVVMLVVLLFLAWMVAAPLDHRLASSPHFPLALRVVGAVLLLPSFGLFLGTFTANSYASGLVRIQSERKQRVVMEGVYGFVRHPMYLGALLMFIGGALLMGSVAGVGVTVVMTLLLAGRIVGEEKTLVEGLDGYDVYRKKVRYRLVPGIW